MRATLFFRVIDKARKIYNRERNLFLMDLCDIGVIPHHFGNYKSFKDHFKQRAFPAPEVKKTVLRGDDPRSAEIVAAAFRAVAPYLGRLN